MDKIKKNERFVLEITDINNLGFGVGRHKGLVVFVANCAVGDIIEAKCVKVTSSYAVAICEKLTVPSPMRTDGGCTHKGCGGCAYQHISYDEEKRLKENYVRHAFIKAGVNAKIMPLTSNGKTTEYRNKAEYPIAKGKDGYIIGFYAPKSHRVVECADCSLQPAVFFEIVEWLRGEFERLSLSVYDEESGKGLLRHIYLRRASTGDIALTLVVTAQFDGQASLCERACARFPEIKNFALNINPEKTNVICSDRYINLFGEGYITDTLAGVRLNISPSSFYQVNHAMTELLYAKARELASLKKGDVLCDLFCGIGSIGLSMVKDCGRLVGIEIIEDAVRCAEDNARQNRIENAEFFAGDASDAERFFGSVSTPDGSPFSPDVILLDPPRKGCTPTLIEYIASRLKTDRVVYISCNPDTLARDCALFERLGYSVGEIYPFDLFPRTGHVESVVRLERLDVDMRR